MTPQASTAKGTRPTAAPQVWLADLEACGAALEAIDREWSLLAETDRARLTMGPSAEARRHRLHSHLALRIVVISTFGASWRGAPYELAASGKLSLTGLDGTFSLSHTAGRALVAVARDASIGVDLEAPREIGLQPHRVARIENAASRLTPCGPLPDADPGRRFLEAWVRLEALGKADGRGVGHVLGALGAWSETREVPPQEAPSAFFDVYDLSLAPPLVAAAAVTRGTPSPEAAVRHLPTDPAALRDLIAHGP